MLEHFGDYGYLGVFVALLASATVVPMPEELPVIMAGILVGHEDTTLRWYIMLPVVMAGVVIGDGLLYGIGRLWGTRLLDSGWVQRNLISPDKRAKIEKNIQDHGIMILLGARLLPGVRGWIFVVAGSARLPLGRFLLADGIYAIPMVNIIFWLSYFLTHQVLTMYNIIHDKVEAYKPMIVVAILSGIAGALINRYIFMRHVSTGEPPHVPEIIAKPAVAVGHAVEKAVEIAVDKVTGRHHDKPQEGVPEPSENGTVESADEKEKREV